MGLSQGVPVCGVRPWKAGSHSMSESHGRVCPSVLCQPHLLLFGLGLCVRVCEHPLPSPPKPMMAFLLLGCRWAPSLVFPAHVCLSSCVCHLCGTPQVPQALYRVRLSKDIPAPVQQVMTGCCHRAGDGRAHSTAQGRGRARLGCASIPCQC